MEMPTDKAPGPDGFTGLFFRSAWQLIKEDIMKAFQAIWSLDGWSFCLVNQAYMVLLRKKHDASTIGDYRPISLIHGFAKLLTRVLAHEGAGQTQSECLHSSSAHSRDLQSCPANS